eukprot:6446771-Prymnesium_polylepis.1
MKLLADQRRIDARRFQREWLDTDYVRMVGNSSKMRPAFWESSWAPPVPVHASTKPEVELFVDGSAFDDGRAGWGFVAVVSTTDDPACTHDVADDHGPVVTDPTVNWRGAEQGTNNTGELCAILHALDWALTTHHTTVRVRYDSEYAAKMTQGEWKPKKNKRLVAAARTLLARCATNGLAVQWLHVKAHSGHKWNDRADELAKLGAGLAAPSAAARATRAPAAPLKPAALDDAAVRWVNWNPSETGRVLRARTAHGVLNAVAGCLPSTASVRDAGDAQMARLENETQQTPTEDMRQARATVRDAVRKLLDPAARRREVQDRKKGWRSSVLTCPINVVALRDLSAARGTATVAHGSGQHTRAVTYTAMIQQILDAVETARSGETFLTIEYTYSALARDLIDAGHVTGSREYA